MSNEARKIDADRRRQLTAGRSIAALGAVGLDPVVQEPEPQQRTHPRSREFRKRLGPRGMLKTPKTKTEAGCRASFAINQAMGKVRKADA